MSLDLVDCRRHLRELAQVDQPVGVEVGYPDGPQLAGPIGFLHGAICAVIITEGLMDQHEVDIIRLQIAQGLVDAGPGLLVAGVGHPDLGGQEHFIPRKAALMQGAAHRRLVAVGLCGINGPIPHIQRIKNAAFALLARHLKDAIAN